MSGFFKEIFLKDPTKGQKFAGIKSHKNAVTGSYPQEMERHWNND